MGDKEISCVPSAAGPIGQQESQTSAPAAAQPPARSAQVGKPAPDFEANSYAQGGFGALRLSQFRGKWVVLCFYPGDFTFV